MLSDVLGKLQTFLGQGFHSLRPRHVFKAGEILLGHCRDRFAVLLQRVIQRFVVPQHAKRELRHLDLPDLRLHGPHAGRKKAATQPYRNSHNVWRVGASHANEVLRSTIRRSVNDSGAGAAGGSALGRHVVELLEDDVGKREGRKAVPISLRAEVGA